MKSMAGDVSRPVDRDGPCVLKDNESNLAQIQGDTGFFCNLWKL